MEWLVPIAVAVIGGPVVVLLQRFRKENRQDHATVTALLDKIDNKIDKVDDKIDKHIHWHLGTSKTRSKK